MDKELQSYYEKIKANQRRFNYKDYALAFLQLMGDRLKYSSSDIEDLLLEPTLYDGTFSLFPVEDNLKKMFSTANYNAVAALVYYLDDIDCGIFTSNKVNNINNKYDYFFKGTQTSIYFLFNLDLSELLLSSSSQKNHILIYFFLLFLPNGDDFLMFNNQGKPFLSLYSVSEDNFELILEVAKDIQKEKLNEQLTSDNNLAVKIIENYLIDIISNMKNPNLEDYKSFYPYEKLHTLAKLDCFPDNAINILSVSLTTMYPEFIAWTDEYSAIVEENIMRESLKRSIKKEQVKKF